MTPPNSQKAYLKVEGSNEKIHCLFNPEKLQVGVSTTWSGERIPGQQTPKLQYGGGQSASMSLELFFDTTSDGTPVTNYTDKLVKLLKVDTNLPGYSAEKMNGRPPYVTFHWGKFSSFKAVVTSLDLQFVYFSSAGEPLRATANLSLTQYEQEDDWPRQNPTSGTPKPARSHQLQPGETLDRIAARYYDDPTEWRRLAEANGVKDPFAMTPGRRVDIPQRED